MFGLKKCTGASCIEKQIANTTRGLDYPNYLMIFDIQFHKKLFLMKIFEKIAHL